MSSPLPHQALADRLTAATVILDGDAEKVKAYFAYAGMPSDYRAGLLAAREEAETFLGRLKLRSTDAQTADRKRIELAESVVELTHAIIFAMKHGSKYGPIFRASVQDLTRLEQAISPELYAGID